MSESWPPSHSRPLAEFTVSGDPKGAGSKDAIPLGRWGTIRNAAEAAVFGRPVGSKWFRAIWRDSGVPIVNVVDTSDKTGGPEWRAAIRAACAMTLDAAHELSDCPLAVRVTFFHPGPKGRYGTGRNAGELKGSADKLPHRSELADGTKLARALEDALNGLLWTDDRRVCDLWWSRRFGRNPGASVQVFALPVSVAEWDELERVVVEPSLFGGDPSVIMGGDDGDHTEALAGADR